MPNKPLLRLGAVALALGLLFDLLFNRSQPGISFPIYVGLVLAAGFLLTRAEGQRPAGAALVLLAPVAGFALLSVLRLEPFSRFLSILLTLFSLFALSLTWLGGRWWQYALLDWLGQGVRLAGAILVKPLELFPPAISQALARPEGQGEPGGRRASRPVLSALLGLGLALPVLAVLGALLASADPIFSQQLRGLLSWFDLDRLPELVARLIWIGLAAFSLAGVYLYALLSSREERLSDPANPPVKPFLGWVTSVTLLTSVNLLFAFFVAVQFRYFFGGQANIHLEGYTYAEYARRGFDELVVVAGLSLLLFLGLSALTRRVERGGRRAFTVLGLVLMGLTAIMLFSAFQRLQLYESAYGFSRIRIYTHVFMVWLGLLLAAAVFLEGTGRLRFFALAALLTALGFAFSLNLLNVDAFIARQNVARAVQGEELDWLYLTELSEDVTPALAALFHDPGLPQPVHDQLGAALACRAAEVFSPQTGQLMGQTDWRAYLPPAANAQRLYAAEQDTLSAYPVHYGDRGLLVVLDGVEYGCQEGMIFD